MEVEYPATETFLKIELNLVKVVIKLMWLPEGLENRPLMHLLISESNIIFSLFLTFLEMLHWPVHVYNGSG